MFDPNVPGEIFWTSITTGFALKLDGSVVLRKRQRILPYHRLKRQRQRHRSHYVTLTFELTRLEPDEP